MKSVKETFGFRAKIVDFQNQRGVLHVRDMDTILTSASRLGVLSVGNLNIMITSAPRRINILIMCKLMTFIIRELWRMSTFLLTISDIIGDLIKSSTSTPYETPV